MDSLFLDEFLAIIPPCHSQKELYQQALVFFKNKLKQERANCEILLLQGHTGLFCAQKLAFIMDEIIKALYDFANKYLYPLENSSEIENLTLIAIGGYGRSTLAPDSDIDLLFLLNKTQSLNQNLDPISREKQMIIFIHHMLWDMGLKVGHSTRTIDETLQIAADNLSVRTSLLDMRLLLGNSQLFQELNQTITTHLIQGTEDHFIHNKLIERDERHKKLRQTRYLLEPNIKESKGGQRDLQTLFWIMKYHYQIESLADMIKIGIFSPREVRIFKKAENFLWTVRCHIHFLTKRAQNCLSFDIQQDIAYRLGYRDHPGIKAVERFMKHYFLTVKQVGELTRIIGCAIDCFPEQDFQKTAIIPKKPSTITETEDFIIDSCHIYSKNDSLFTENPVNLIRLFYLADHYECDIHPNLLQKAARSLSLIDTKLRRNPIANDLFMQILTSPRDPARILHLMNETDILGKFIPDFGKIVAMMQFNTYHHYTVDEHLLRAIHHLSALEKTSLEATPTHNHSILTNSINNRDPDSALPPSPATALILSILPLSKTHRYILYSALLLHDIAKGRMEDHSLAGEQLALKLCPRLGLSGEETATIAWLVREHLTMSQFAQSRDLGDPRTIHDFVTIVSSVERLQLLLLLTICDIKAVGPNVWNGWKEQLLCQLYHAAKIFITGHPNPVPYDLTFLTSRNQLETIKTRMKASFCKIHPDFPIEYMDLHQDNYWVAVTPKDQIHHAHLILDAQNYNKIPTFTITLRQLESITELVIFAKDHPRLLALITRICATTQANIVSAQIFTTTKGHALDIIRIERNFVNDQEEECRATRIAQLIMTALEKSCHNLENNAFPAKLLLPPLPIAKYLQQNYATQIFSHQPSVDINNNISDQFSVIEIEGSNQMGILSQITEQLSLFSINISSAHINSFGEKIMDSFYVTDLSGKKITNPDDQQQICQSLLALFKNIDQKTAPL